MSKSVADFEKELLDLPEEIRAELADVLLSSLATLPSGIERAHMTEVERRLRELNAGRSTTIALADVMKKADEIVNAD